jgi:hypothetical protein
MAKRRLPKLNTIEQRMMTILLAVLVLVALLLGTLVRKVATTVAVASAQSLGLVDDAAAGSGVVSGSRIYRGVISPVFTPEVRYWEGDIARWAAAHGLDPNMVATVMQIESCGDPQAQSGAGARGLFQVMPFHFAAGENMFDPDTNASRGMNYLRERLAQTRGDVGLAFAGYNGGHVAAGGSWNSWSSETQRYYVWSTGIYGEVRAGLTSSPTLDRWLAAGGASLCQQASRRLGLE